MVFRFLPIIDRFVEIPMILSFIAILFLSREIFSIVMEVTTKNGSQAIDDTTY